MKVKLSYLAAFFVLFLFASNDLVAQDKIYKKNKKEAIEAKVLEIGTGEIKYQIYGEADGLVYVVEKTAILRIEFEDGRTEFYGKEKMDMEEYFEGQKTKGLKISFLGPLVGNTNLTYEQSIRPGRSFEIKAAFVGLGINREEGDDPRGVIVSAGYKLMKKPTFLTSDTRRRHILQGGYLKPEIFLGHTSFDTNNIFGPGDVRESSTTGGFILNLGKQWVFSEVVLLDFFVGIGYGTGESRRSTFVNNNFAFQSGLNVGIAF